MFVQILVSAKTRGPADGCVWLQAERRTSQAPWRRHAHIRTCARRGCLGPSRCSGSCGVVASRTACSSGKSWQGCCARESARGCPEAKGLKRQRHSSAVLATHRDELALDVEPEEFPPRRRRPMATCPRLVPQAPAARRHVTSPSPQPQVHVHGSLAFC